MWWVASLCCAAICKNFFAGPLFPFSMDQKPLILVTNDDGITATRYCGPGRSSASPGPGSGGGPRCATERYGPWPLPLANPCDWKKVVDVFEGIEAWQCSGTPGRLCGNWPAIKFWAAVLISVFRALTMGANHSINVLYSGTMSAAMEAAIEGVPSIGFSLLNFKWEADFTLAGKVARQLVETLFERFTRSAYPAERKHPQLPAGRF